MSSNGAAAAEFVSVHDGALGIWDRAMRTGETAELEHHMSESFHVLFGRFGVDHSEHIDRASAIAGMRKSVASLRGATKRFENRHIRMRNATEAVVFFEQVIDQGGQVLARLMTVECWRYGNGKWTCIRETVEPVDP